MGGKNNLLNHTWIKVKGGKKNNHTKDGFRSIQTNFLGTYMQVHLSYRSEVTGSQNVRGAFKPSALLAKQLLYLGV